MLGTAGKAKSFWNGSLLKEINVCGDDRTRKKEAKKLNP